MEKDQGNQSSGKKMDFYNLALEKLIHLQNRQVIIPPNLRFIFLKQVLRQCGIKMETCSLFPVLHVTGTKGKGSVCNHLTELLKPFYSVVTYTSPHVLEARERIKVNGIPISKERFARTFFQIFKRAPGQHYSDILFVMCLKICQEEKPDVGIFEVGCGGRFDSTNIMENVPMVTITSIDFDHEELLGNTLESIAWNKAGIIKPKSYVFLPKLPEETKQVINEEIKTKNAKLIYVKSEANFHYQKMDLQNWNIAKTMAELFVGFSLENERPKRIAGRRDIKEFRNSRFFIDGAHTFDSILYTVEWFMSNCFKTNFEFVENQIIQNTVKLERGIMKMKLGKNEKVHENQTDQEKQNEKDQEKQMEKDQENRIIKKGLILQSNVKFPTKFNNRILIFNVTGSRDHLAFFSLLKQCRFSRVYFTKNVSGLKESLDVFNAKENNNQIDLAIDWCGQGMVFIRENLMECLKEIPAGSNVLVTGSLYLVSALYQIIPIKNSYIEDFELYGNHPLTNLIVNDLL